MNDKQELSPSDLDMIASINSERFTTEELLEISAAVHELPEDCRSWEARILMLNKRFPGKHHRGLAAESRLAAMFEMISSGTLRLGVLPKSADGSQLVENAVFKAAALEPLLWRNNKFAFDSKSFKERILEGSASGGKA